MPALHRVSFFTLIIAALAVAGFAHAQTHFPIQPLQYSMAPPGPALPFIKKGKLPALAVANPQRLALLPDLPTMREVRLMQAHIF